MFAARINKSESLCFYIAGKVIENGGNLFSQRREVHVGCVQSPSRRGWLPLRYLCNFGSLLTGDSGCHKAMLANSEAMPTDAYRPSPSDSRPTIFQC
jgi:hypothetical protein